MNRRNALAAISAASATAIANLTGCGSNATKPSGYTRNGLKPGLQAPIIAGPDLDGESMSLDQFRGNVVLLEFWSPT
jgi:hypothetical protein